MAIQLANTRKSQATNYGTLGTFFNACTGAPGTTTTPANEATGGSPANARIATTWAAATDNGTTASIVGSAVTVNLPAATYTFATLCSALTGAFQVDNCSITSTVLSAQGQIVLTPTYSQT